MLTEVSQVLLPALCPERIMLLVLNVLLLTVGLLYFKCLNTATDATNLNLTILRSQGMVSFSAAVAITAFCQDSSYVGASFAITFR